MISSSVVFVPTELNDKVVVGVLARCSFQKIVALNTDLLKRCSSVFGSCRTEAPCL